MTERWQRELKKLGGVDAPVSRMRAQIANGPGEDPPQPEPGRSPRQRITAGVVAFAVFAAAGVFAWKAFQPGRVSPGGAGSGLPTLEINLSKTGAASPSPGDPSGGAAAFSANLRFGDLQFAETPPVFGSQPLTTIKEPVGVRAFAPLTPALTAGSDVTFQTDATQYVATIRAADASSDVPTTLSDSRRLPTTPGLYLVVIHATWSDGFAEWYLQVSLLAPGTMQLWSPDETSPGASAAPNVDLVVDGRMRSPGVVNASGANGPVPDAYPSTDTALDVPQRAPLAIYPSAVRGLGTLSWVESASPHARVGTVDLTVSEPALDASPGTYYFSIQIQTPEFAGDLVYPITVVDDPLQGPPPTSPPPAGSEIVRVSINTTPGTTGCPGGPEGSVAYGHQSAKGFGTSFTWTCPGSEMNADAIMPAFSNTDFLQVPSGARLLLDGDFNAAEGKLQVFQGGYPWPTVQDFGDLVAGADLSFDPGRYVMEVTAHWTNGDRQFYFPIELVPPASPTPPPDGVPDVLKISCDGGVPSIIDPFVAVQADGLHVRMVGAVPPNEQIALYGRDGYFLATTGVATFESGTDTGGFTRSAATGIYDVKCFPKGVDPATINAATTVRVVDPNHFWVSTELGCPIGDRGAVSSTDGPHPTEEAAVRALSGVAASDTVEPAGYTHDLVDRQRYTDYAAWRVVRDGEVVAWTWVNRSQGSWQAVHGVGCVSAGTGHPSTGPSSAPTNSPSP